MGLKIMAEVIEQAEQGDMLRQFGCEYAQGYHHRHPLPAQEFERYMEIATAENNNRTTELHQGE